MIGNRHHMYIYFGVGANKKKSRYVKHFYYFEDDMNIVLVTVKHIKLVYNKYFCFILHFN